MTKNNRSISNAQRTGILITLLAAAFKRNKVAFDEEKAAFEHRLSEMAANTPTKNKAMRLFDAYSYDGVFGRAEIMQMFDIASSSAGKFLTKLKDLHFIEQVSGQGKGKYRFIAQ